MNILYLSNDIMNEDILSCYLILKLFGKSISTVLNIAKTLRVLYIYIKLDLVALYCKLSVFSLKIGVWWYYG